MMLLVAMSTPVDLARAIAWGRMCYKSAEFLDNKLPGSDKQGANKRLYNALIKHLYLCNLEETYISRISNCYINQINE